MGLKDSLGKYVNFSEGDYYDDADGVDYDYDDARDDEYEDDAPISDTGRSSAPKKSFFDVFRSKGAKNASSRHSEPDYDDVYDDDDYYEEAPTRGASPNVVDFSSKSKSGGTKVILAKPSLFDGETAKDIARHVNKQRLVLLNLEQMSDSDMRRMLDFLSGVVFANDGKINGISNKTFIVLPHNYDFSGDVLENLKNGYYSI